MGYTKQQLAVIEADKNYWEELADVLGWKLHGFTDRNTACFYTGRNGVYIGSTLTLTGSERNKDSVRYSQSSALTTAPCP